MQSHHGPLDLRNQCGSRQRNASGIRLSKEGGNGEVGLHEPHSNGHLGL